MKLLSGRSFIVVMAVFSCATATGCFSCSEKTVNQPTPAVVVQPAPVVVEPTPWMGELGTVPLITLGRFDWDAIDLALLEFREEMVVRDGEIAPARDRQLLSAYKKRGAPLDQGLHQKRYLAAGEYTIADMICYPPTTLQDQALDGFGERPAVKRRWRQAPRGAPTYPALTRGYWWTFSDVLERDGAASRGR
jgi:hypothetical protein